MTGAARRAPAYSKVMSDTYWLMLQLAFASVWLVIFLAWIVRFLKWTPSMFTEADLPCRLMVVFTSALTFVKWMS